MWTTWDIRKSFTSRKLFKGVGGKMNKALAIIDYQRDFVDETHDNTDVSEAE